MGKIQSLKLLINKKNNQINTSFKRKDLPKDILKDIMNIKKVKVEIKGWE